MSIIIRPIQPEDNEAVCKLIVNTIREFGYGGNGFATEDAETQAMYGYYQDADNAYYVLWDDEKHQIVGGGGFSRLKGTTLEEGICELQKVYFLPSLRGQGLGKKLLSLLIEEATKAGYTEMYLETLPGFESAIALYEKLGFQYIPGAKGNTGHYSCKTFMTLDLHKATVSV